MKEGIKKLDSNVGAKAEATHDIEFSERVPDFDAKIELGNLKSLPKLERKKKIIEIREALDMQRQGISEIILMLKKEIHLKPDATVSDLRDIFDRMAPRFRLNTAQCTKFYNALRIYGERHSAVIDFREKHKDNSELFEVCFGFKPKGKVEVVAGPITMHFRCFEDEDYLSAYNWNSERDKDGKVSQKELDHAKMTSGVALTYVKPKELQYVVTIEKASSHLVYVEREVEETMEIKGGNGVFWFVEQVGNIKIKHKSGREFTIKLSERRDDGEPMRLTLLSAGSDKPIFDFRKRLGDVSPDDYEVDDLVFGGRLEGFSGVSLVRGGVNGLRLVTDSFSVKISGDAEVSTVENKLVDVYDEEESLATRIHEEQHQFNKLFEPLETRSQIEEVMVEAVRKFDGIWDAVNYVAHWFAKQDRSYFLGIDGRARDEILAFYRDGRNLQEIYKTLTTSKVYDYFSKNKKRLETELPDMINRQINANIKIFYPLRSVNITAEDLKPVIDGVFKTEYKDDVRVWIGAIQSLEEKGYNRDEIISYLAQEPVSAWKKLAKRLASKEKTVE